MNVLALNSGSSSLKFGVANVGIEDVGVEDVGSGFEWRFEGQVESIGGDASRFVVRDPRGGVVVDEQAPVPDASAALQRIERWLEQSRFSAPDAVGHRVVHGGPDLRSHCVIDDDVMSRLDAAKAFAPLHVPPALAIIGLARERFPNAAHVACFDTAFHASLPDEARTLPIAREWRRVGVRRYGFHGLSCESIVRQLGSRVPSRLVIAHLGNGASVTAVKDGQSIDTSMGLTPSGGAMMGSRSGDIDPGVLIYLLREKGFDADRLEQLIDHDSGLRGISGVSNDMRELHAAAASSPDAALAITMFGRSVSKQVAAMAVVLNGIDLLVFTGGIGENDESIRSDIVRGLGWMPPFDVAVLPSQEDAQIARHTAALAT